MISSRGVLKSRYYILRIHCHTIVHIVQDILTFTIWNSNSLQIPTYCISRFKVWKYASDSNILWCSHVNAYSKITKNTCAADNILTALRHLSAVFKLFIVMRVFVLQFTYTLTKKVDFVSYPVIVLFYTCVG